MKKAQNWDAAEFLDNPEDVVTYLNAALAEGDAELFNAALGNAARASGMTNLSREVGVSRDGLYKALSKTGNPSFQTVIKVVKALGLQLTASPAQTN